MKLKGLVVFILGSGLLWGVTLDLPSSVSQEAPKQTMRRVCSRCHALQIMSRCVAGDCQGDRVVRLLKPAPWDFVLDWMKSFGADMTETEKRTIQTYLQSRYPAEPYPLPWVKLPTYWGEGGWNVVSLKGHTGYLYVGLEGNGKIFRSSDGISWQEVAHTDQHTTYGILAFQGALYAATNDPSPQIWKSATGLNWTSEASLSPEDRGVISLGVFEGYLYAGTGRGWIYRSRDGQKWEKMADLKGMSTAAYVHWVRFLIPFQKYFYAGLEHGQVYRTSDGRRWEPITQPITGQVGARGAAVFGSSLYVGTTGTGQIWRTRDGVNWHQVFTAPPHLRRGYVAGMVVAGDTLYATVDGYVFRSQDGTQWDEVGHLGPHTLEAITAFNHHLYVGTLMPPQAMLYRAPLTEK